MQSKELIRYIVVIVIGLILINLHSANLIDIRVAANRLMDERIIELHLLGTAYCFLLGVLLQWRNVLKLAKREVRLKINPLLIPGIILLLISLMHPIFFLYQLGLGLTLPFSKGGIGTNMLLAPLIQGSTTQNILSIISGFIVIEGLYKTNNSSNVIHDLNDVAQDKKP